ncbi:hypothetical protein [Mariniplasma anaerobium]|nr:hypothetical protein [Mariniplasma anaerobium]
MMQGSIIKNTIQLDKEARIKIDELKKEKDHLDERLKTETVKLQKSYDQDNKKILDERKTSYQEEIKARQEKEKNTYDKTLKDIQKQYKENRDSWIKDIYEACIKP